ncbi:hypothetical protein M0802_001764 [Mischocyttarus mexicanus]|nr:hypothetical protein M0802_001764 [Mischocyttarus mexicanus]
MEDSYTVHRRRKAAAKRREKTPEPSSRLKQVEMSEDDDEIRRAKMEKMAEDTEKMEEELLKKREEKYEEMQGEYDQIRNTKVNLNDKKNISIEDGNFDASLTQTTATTTTTTTITTTTTVTGPTSKLREIDDGKTAEVKIDEVEVVNKTDEDIGKKDNFRIRDDEKELIDTRKVEKRTKKKSKDRTIERHHHHSTDSSEEKSDVSPGRMKSSEIVRPRTKKSSSNRGRFVDSDKSLREKNIIDSKIRIKDKTDKKSFHSGDLNEDIVEVGTMMKKSESFPPRSLERQPIIKKSATDVRKQVIPLSNDTLIEDFAKAQREYLLRERSIMDPDLPEDYQDASDVAVGTRKRKIPTIDNEMIEQKQLIYPVERKKPIESTVSNWFELFWRKKKTDNIIEDKQLMDVVKYEQTEEIIDNYEEELPEESSEELSKKKITIMDFLRALKDIASELKAFMIQNPTEIEIIRNMRNRCMGQLILIMIYCGLGAFVFRFTEGAFETFYKCGVKRVKRDFLDSLWNYSHNLREDDWKSLARRKLMEFEEQLHTAHEAGVHTYSGQRSWTFLNAVVYCLTVITTIGYGHISPSTTTGRAITIVYAIFGIPMFLILLADFGKLFTRGIKFLWAFVRRLYYTGSCRNVRRTVPVQVHVNYNIINYTNNHSFYY